MVDKLDQVAAHCQLMVKLSSLHFKANWVGGLIINLLGLLSEGNIVGTLGVKGGDSNIKGISIRSYSQSILKLCYRWMDRRHKTTSAMTISPQPVDNTPGDLLAISIRRQWNRYFYRCYWTRNCLCT